MSEGKERRSQITDPDTSKVSELCISIHIHLDYTIADSNRNFFLSGTRSAMENQVAGKSSASARYHSNRMGTLTGVWYPSY